MHRVLRVGQLTWMSWNKQLVLHVLSGTVAKVA